MAERESSSSVVDLFVSKPHVEILDEPDEPKEADASREAVEAELAQVESPQPREAQAETVVRGKVRAGKIPGKLHELEINGRTTIGALFGRLELDIDNCELQKNGKRAKPTDLASPGDNILAIAKIRGN